MNICSICGKEKPNYQYGDFFPDRQCLGHPDLVPSCCRQFFPDIYQQKPCEHCYCKEELIEGKMHLVCCMCGNRKLK